ncbi:glycoside hydrolase [Irpex lacteus]|nr:glycoside hydrolase [Irpex lacteus]
MRKHAGHPSGTNTSTPAANVQAVSSLLFPSSKDFYRYRKQRGVNLGSWFVLERWISEAPFRSAVGPAQSDLDVPRGPDAQQILEQHWDTWITERDWTWIADKGLNSVRIPVGYYHICGADSSVLEGTDFAGLEHVFRGAWQRITNALHTANRFGIGVLIDLHAAPGKQNRDSHSGATGEPRFFNKANMAHTIRALTLLTSHLTAFCQSFDPPLPNLLGIELLNEPQQDPSLEQWYKEAIHSIRAIDPTIPIYIGDSWMTDHYAGYISSNASTAPFTVLDHHLYRCFTHEDISTPASQHAKGLTDPNAGTPQMLSRVAQKLEAAGGALIIGEWSGALNPGSLHNVGDEVSARREYVQAQLALFERHCAGCFFWTYKKEQQGDKGWSLRDAARADIFPYRVGLSGREKGLREDPEWHTRRIRARDKALGEHQGYWSRYPGHYEHWRFDEGFLRGWDDAWLFFRSISSLPPNAFIPELGFKGPWLKMRLKEHTATKGTGNLWEYEHGFPQGVQAARSDLTGLL